MFKGLRTKSKKKPPAPTPAARPAAESTPAAPAAPAKTKPKSRSSSEIVADMVRKDQFDEHVPGYKVGPILSPTAPGLRKGVDEATGLDVALKPIAKTMFLGNEEAVNGQLELLQSVKHPNVASMLAFIYTDNYLVIVFEMPTGAPLFDDVAARDRFTENDLRNIVNQLLSAVEYLHSKFIVHRNITTETVWLDDNGTVKLIDLPGAASGDDNATINTLLIGHSAPLVWDSMPPEMVLYTDQDHSLATDMWSVGCLVYVLLMGYPPFWGTDQKHLYQNITKCNYKFSSPYADNVSRASRHWVSSLLKINPSDRHNAVEAKQDPWMTGTYINDIDEQVVPDKHLHANHQSLKVWNETRQEAMKVENAAGMPPLLSLQSGTSQYMHPEHAALIVQAYIKGNYARAKYPVKGKINIAPPETQAMSNIKDKYDVGKQLGKGAFGTVVLATHKKNKTKVAIKMIRKREVVEKQMQEQVQEEINLQASLDHPNLVKIVEVIDTKRYVCLVQELLTGGELFDKIVEYKFFSEKQAQILATQMLEGIKYLHDNNIAHRDLKPENILFETRKDDALMKITDFGYAHLSESGTYKNVVGTLDYMAPEVFRRERYSNKCDIWSAGVIVFCMVCGCPPFRGGSDDDIRNKILNGDLKWPRRSAGLSDEARAFIYRLLEMNPKDRYTAEEALNDPWLHSEPPNVNLEETMTAMKKWNAVRKLRRGLIAATAVSKLETAMSMKAVINKAAAAQ